MILRFGLNFLGNKVANVEDLDHRTNLKIGLTSTDNYIVVAVFLLLTGDKCIAKRISAEVMLNIDYYTYSWLWIIIPKSIRNN